MTGLSKNWKTDTSKENDGVEFEYDQNDDGTIPKFWLRRSGCSAHVKAQNQIFEEFRTQQRLKIIPHEKNLELTRNAFAIGCIAKWENVQDDNGNPIEFNSQNACELLKGMADLYYDLAFKSDQRQNYKADILEVNAKN